MVGGSPLPNGNLLVDTAFEEVLERCCKVFHKPGAIDVLFAILYCGKRPHRQHKRGRGTGAGAGAGAGQQLTLWRECRTIESMMYTPGTLYSERALVINFSTLCTTNL